MTLINIYNELIRSASVSGRENKTAEKIISLITPFVDTVEKDSLGSVAAVRHGKAGAKRLMLVCGMDTPGFFATFFEKSGMIRIAPVGEMNTDSLIYSALKFESGTQGFLVSDGKKGSEASFWADIGAKNIKDAKKKVSQGDFCLPVGGGRLLSGDIYGFGASSAIVAALMAEIAQRIYNSESEYEMIYLFTAQSRVGARGAAPAAMKFEVDAVLTFDGMSEGVNIGDGPVLKIKDGSYISSPQLVQTLRDVADDYDIKVQNAVQEKNPSSLLALQMSLCAPAVSVAIPVKYRSTMGEKINIKDAEKLIDLTLAFAKRG